MRRANHCILFLLAFIYILHSVELGLCFYICSMSLSMATGQLRVSQAHSIQPCVSLLSFTTAYRMLIPSETLGM